VNSKRMDYLDMTKGFGIILVVMGHIIYTETHILVWLSSFHMPLFFVVAGILMAVKDEDHSKPLTCISRKARGLLIPYLWFSIIDFVLDIGNVVFNKIDLHTFEVNAISSLTFYGKSVLWFLTALFFSECYFILLRSRFSDRIVAVTVIVMAAICYFIKIALDNLYLNNADSLLITSLINTARSFVRAAMVLPFIAGSFYLWKYLLKSDSPIVRVSVIKKERAIQLLIAASLIVVNIIVSMINWSVDTNNMVFGNIFLYYIGGFTGSLGVVLFFKCMPAIRILSYLGRNSLIIMATHLDAYILWAGLKVGLVVFGLIPFAPLFIVISVMITLLIECIIIEIINRFCPFIIGKKREAKTC